MPIPRDYRSHKNPKLWSYEILVRFIKTGKLSFTSNDVVKEFNICPAEACTRINVLRKYNCIKPVKPRKYPAEYQITNWGYKYASEKIKDVEQRNYNKIDKNLC